MHTLLSKVFIATVLSLVAAPALAATINLLNVSYDPTREFYQNARKASWFSARVNSADANAVL